MPIPHPQTCIQAMREGQGVKGKRQVGGQRGVHHFDYNDGPLCFGLSVDLSGEDFSRMMIF